MIITGWPLVLTRIIPIAEDFILLCHFFVEYSIGYAIIKAEISSQLINI